MSASRNKKERQAAFLSEAGQRQQEAKEAKKIRCRHIVYAVIGIVLVVAVAALLFWDSGFVQKHSTALTVNDEKYGIADLDYYFYSNYNAIYNYASIYGLDTDTDLKDQTYSEGVTWYDYILETATSSLTNISILCQEAEAAGYTLSEDGQANVESALSSVETYASYYGYTTDTYLQAMYGSYMTVENYTRIMTDYYLANEFAQEKTESFEITDEEVDTYYSENAATLDTFLYDCYLVSADMPSESDYEDDEDGLANARESALADAAENAADLLAAMESGDEDTISALAAEYSATNYSDSTYFSYYNYADWLTDESRTAGDSTTVEYTSGDVTSGYYVLVFHDRYLDEYHAVNAYYYTISATSSEDSSGNTVYDMDTAMSTAQSTLDTWQSEGGTEELFAALAEENSGTLAEGISKTAFSDDIIQWLYDDSRAAGDTTVIGLESSGVVYVLYFVSTSDTPYWYDVSYSALQDNYYDAWYEETESNYTVNTGFGSHFVGD